MLTVMCPNCRHHFPAPGCCDPNGRTNQKETDEERKPAATIHPAATCYVGGFLVPHGYTSNGSCFINAPTIIHGPAIFQTDVVKRDSTVGIANSEIDQIINHDLPGFSGNKKTEQSHCLFLKSQAGPLNDLALSSAKNIDSETISSERHIATQCELTDSNVTIAPSGIHSGGCLIQSTEAEILVQVPHVEIRPEHTGGGCLMRKRLSVENEQPKYMEEIVPIGDNLQRILTPPSGCLELPGNRGTLPSRATAKNSETTHMESRQQKISNPIKGNGCCCNYNDTTQNPCHEQSSDTSHTNNRNSLLLEPVNGGMQIQVNATVQLPANLGQCKVNITATATPSSNPTTVTEPRSKNNFCGGGIVQPDELTGNLNVAGNSNNCNSNCNSNCNEQKDGAPTTPVSWLMPYPWSLDSYLIDKDFDKLCNVKRLLQTCGWYHEGISWQQSESLLKTAPVGRWLMRDSSDSRYIFAVSVQTDRGPTSVRVHYLYGRFRLDAEPRLALAMPLFDCPISMLEYYVEYSKRIDEHRKEVWVDHSGQLYSQIYLTEPLVKQVRSLSHLARLTVNQNKLPTQHLPLLLRDYLAEYPYML